MPPATRNQLIPVRVFDRRNHFAREGLRRVMSRHFAHGELVITAPDAAERFQLPLALCQRLLDELVCAGVLARSVIGAYSGLQNSGGIPPEGQAVITPGPKKESAASPAKYVLLRVP
jgi:hypothetical protein